MASESLLSVSGSFRTEEVTCDHLRTDERVQSDCFAKMLVTESRHEVQTRRRIHDVCGIIREVENVTWINHSVLHFSERRVCRRRKLAAAARKTEGPRSQL